LEVHEEREDIYMEEKVLYSMESPFQQEINVKGYYFGKNEGKEHCRRNFEKTYGRASFTV
jgi:hypothetical protein